MQPFRIAIIAICLLCMLGGAVLISEAATTFNGSTIVGIDQAKRTVTFQTKEGQTWTLAVNDPNMLNKNQIAKGDQVSIEVDLSDRISKITKLSDQLPAEQNQSRDDTRGMTEPAKE